MHVISLDNPALTQYLSGETLPPVRQPLTSENANEAQKAGKAAFLVVKKIREGILDEVFKPGDRLGEVDLAEKFEVSRSPVREALLALEKEGTVVISRHK